MFSCHEPLERVIVVLRFDDHRHRPTDSFSGIKENCLSAICLWHRQHLSLATSLSTCARKCQFNNVHLIFVYTDVSRWTVSTYFVCFSYLILFPLRVLHSNAAHLCIDPIIETVAGHKGIGYWEKVRDLRQKLFALLRDKGKPSPSKKVDAAIGIWFK